MTETTNPEPTKDRAEAAGLPPDSGPEQLVLQVRPSLWRAYPVRASLLILLTLASLIAGPILLPGLGWIVGPSVAAVLVLILFIWWLNVTIAHSVRITNKRTEERRGIFSRSTNEVLHDHVRNIQVDQSFVERIFGVGKVGISSSGQDGIEIEVRDLPNPDRVKEIIDLYRPL
jgi:uncharacterized membrane protein YdbT with pleckstrin-like domain